MAGDEHGTVERRGGVRERQRVRQHDVAESVRAGVHGDHVQERRGAVAQPGVDQAARLGARVRERLADRDAVAADRIISLASQMSTLERSGTSIKEDAIRLPPST